MESDLARISEKHPIVMFDGVCNLCNASVQWIIRNDPKHQFRFLPLQSSRARDFLNKQNVNFKEKADLDSVMLVEDGRLYNLSSAALRIASHLRFPWTLLTVFRIVPSFIRDFIYRLIARHRYRIFGRKDQCMIPTPETRDLFLKED